jgi:hypothetical protein
MTKEQIHNIYLHMTGKAEGLLEAGAEADFPVIFAEAIMEYNKPRELTDKEILRIADSIVINDRTLGNFSIDFARAILKKASSEK